MQRYNFPFTAILGQDNLKLGLLLNVIDPQIGGVLLTGQQGTGKSTAVRSLVDILPEIEINKGCQFNCDHIQGNPQDFCEYCHEKPYHPKKIPTPLVNLPLGATEEMVIGSLDIEQIIREGKRAIQPGLLAKAHRGILYIDEINLLQDHLVDILLDVSASGVNVIEREGISLQHPAKFVLVGSMNPEEGELRPQISDRLGLEVMIQAPTDPTIRAEITRRVIAFNDNPIKFIKEYEKEQKELKERLQKAKLLLPQIKITQKIYRIAAELVLELGLYSQRADLTFIRCARAYTAYQGKTEIGDEEMRRSLQLVFEHRIKRYREDVDAEFLGMTFDKILHKIPEAIEDPNLYKPAKDEQGRIFKHSPEVREKYHENPLDNNNKDIPEVQDARKSHDRYSNFNSEEDFTEGYKVGNDYRIRRTPAIDPAKLALFRVEKPLQFDTAAILKFLRFKRKISNYTGRGSRVRVQSLYNGRYISARKTRGTPKIIAFDASIKTAFLEKHIVPLNKRNQTQSTFSNSQKQTATLLNVKKQSAARSSIRSSGQFRKQYKKKELAVQLRYSDIKEKIHELYAPLTLFFIVDASASMRRTLEQIIKIIQSVHAEGYKKKDKVSVISFQGRQVQILQRPSVSFSIGLQRLRQIEATSYTPLAAGLRKVLTMIRQEQIKGMSIPAIIILSDLGANISQRKPDENPTTDKDFMEIADELKAIAKEIGKKDIKMIVIKPKKSFATRFLGIHPQSAKTIEEHLINYAGAKIFEANLYDSDATILELKKLLSSE